MRLTRIRRLIRLLGLLHSGCERGVESLALACHVSSRTLFRDLALLRDAGVAIAFDVDFERHRITSPSYLPPLQLSLAEALAMRVLCGGSATSEGLPFQAPAKSAAIKIESQLPRKLRDDVWRRAAVVEVHLDNISRLQGCEEAYHLLVAAAANRHSVRLKYRESPEQDALGTKLSPYVVCFHSPTWYVIGRSSYHRKTRSFQLGRISRIEALSEPFRVPRGFSLARHRRNAWRLSPEPGADVDVHVRFDARVSREVAEVTWHKTQRLVPREDGQLDFYARVSGLREMVPWILGYGDHAEVISPTALRAIICHTCDSMISRYTDAKQHTMTSPAPALALCSYPSSDLTGGQVSAASATAHAKLDDAKAHRVRGVLARSSTLSSHWSRSQQLGSGQPGG
jgi:predicted DNA-binding transcriptional regulator YafY